MFIKRSLNEASRGQLISKSKNADVVKSYGTTRYGRKDYQHVEDTTDNLNRVDFNALFKADLLSLIIPVQGETSEYNVEILFEGVCSNIKDQIKNNNYIREYKCIYRALIDAINKYDLYVSCDCKDFKFRQAYYASKGRYNSGQTQITPSRITNPNDTKGAGCKHIMKVISDLDWLLNLSTCINNYITYIEENYNDKYRDIIFPAIYGIDYDSAINRGIIDIDDNEIDNINIEEEPIEDSSTEPSEESQEEEL